MSATALILVLLSAVLHAAWNGISKSRQPSTSFFLIASAAGALMLSPILFTHLPALARFPPRTWLFLAGTGLSLALYYGSLAGAYRHGHLSVAYPIARAFPLIVVILVTLLLGRGRQVSPLCVAGIVMIVSGCLLLPMKRFRDFHLRHFLNLSCGLALLAAFGSAGYTILDDEALRLLRNEPALGLGKRTIPLLYASLETTSCALWLALGLFSTPSGRASLRLEWRASRYFAISTGAAIWSSYILILFAYAYVVNVSYAAAFRQLSIPLGVAFGLIVLKEPAHVPKLTGTLILFAGLLLVALG